MLTSNLRYCPHLLQQVLSSDLNNEITDTNDGNELSSKGSWAVL